MTTESHFELHALRRRLQEISLTIPSYTSATIAPPIIDSSIGVHELTPRHDSIQGLRMFREAVQTDLDVLEKVLLSLHETCRESNSRTQ